MTGYPQIPAATPARSPTRLHCQDPTHQLPIARHPEPRTNS